MTRRERILKILQCGETSCSEICDIILEENNFNYSKNNLTSSLSGTLNQMVRRAEIEISTDKEPRGGKIYKLKKYDNRQETNRNSK